jgi:hypothetical protein
MIKTSIEYILSYTRQSSFFESRFDDTDHAKKILYNHRIYGIIIRVVAKLDFFLWG